MRVKQAGLVPALLWLAGCAAVGPTQQAQEQLQQVEVQEQVQSEQPEQDQEQERTLTAARALASLEHVATLDAKNAKQMIKQLQTGSAELSPGDRFELVLLLSQKGSSNKSQKRAWRLLDGLEADVKEPGVKEILHLQRRILTLEQLHRLEHKKTAELQKKIEYLKGLERELDESNRRIEEPLSTRPESAP